MLDYTEHWLKPNQWIVKYYHSYSTLYIETTVTNAIYFTLIHKMSSISFLILFTSLNFFDVKKDFYNLCDQFGVVVIFLLDRDLHSHTSTHTDEHIHARIRRSQWRNILLSKDNFGYFNTTEIYHKLNISQFVSSQRELPSKIQNSDKSYVEMIFRNWFE